MTYTDLLGLFYQNNFQRIERDDRLIDVFPHEDREKGIELWERWSEKNVALFRIRLPVHVKGLELYMLPRSKVEALLLKNEKAELSEFGPLFRGTEAIEYLQRKIG